MLSPPNPLLLLSPLLSSLLLTLQSAACLASVPLRCHRRFPRSLHSITRSPRKFCGIANSAAREQSELDARGNNSRPKTLEPAVSVRGVSSAGCVGAESEDEQRVLGVRLLQGERANEPLTRCIRPLRGKRKRGTLISEHKPCRKVQQKLQSQDIANWQDKVQ